MLTAEMNVGVLGLGLYLPSEIRTNDWWSEETQKSWRTNVATEMSQARAAVEIPDLPGPRAIAAALRKYATDPFRGAKERRVMPRGMTALDMEEKAAASAIEDAGIDRDEIGLVLHYGFCPDFVHGASACAVHHRMGLSTTAACIDANAGCESMQAHLLLASAMIKSGQCKYALIVQSSAASPFIRPEDASSPWAGDGCSALVLGPVPKPYGILSSVHQTDSEYHRALVFGIPGKRWFEDGWVRVYGEEKGAARRMALMVADQAKTVINRALDIAGLAPSDIDFFAPHQSTPWMLELTRDFVGLENAKGVETFSWAGTLFAANIPIALSSGIQEGLLRDGDLVATFSMGTGTTYSSTILRWGRGSIAQG